MAPVTKNSSYSIFTSISNLLPENPITTLVNRIFSNETQEILSDVFDVQSKPSLIVDTLNHLTTNKSDETAITDPKDDLTDVELCTNPPFTEMPVKNIFRAFILSTFKTSLLPPPQNLETTKPTSTRSSLALFVILSITSLQHTLAQYYTQNSSEKNPLYGRISNHISLGSMAGTFTSWAFNQNLYMGAAIGSIAALPIGLSLDYLQNKIGNPTVEKAEKAVDKILYGGRTFLECTLAACIGPLSWKTLPLISESPYIDRPVRLVISAFWTLVCLSHLESAYPSKDFPNLESGENQKEPKQLIGSKTLTFSKYFIQTLLASYAVLNLNSHFHSLGE